MVKGVIFDMDGTMFDTEPLSTKGWIYAGKKLSVDIPVALTDSFRGRNPQAIRKNLQHILETDWITIQRVQ